MKELVSFLVFVMFISMFLYLNVNEHVGADIGKLQQYEGHLVTDMYEEDILWPNTVTLRSDTSETILFMDDIVFEKLSVGMKINTYNLKNNK